MFFFENRLQQLNEKIGEEKANFDQFKIVANNIIKKAWEETTVEHPDNKIKDNKNNKYILKGREVSRKLNDEIRSLEKCSEELSLLTKDVFGFFSSFFLPFTKAYKCRESAEEHLLETENHLNSLIKYQRKFIAQQTK